MGNICVDKWNVSMFPLDCLWEYQESRTYGKGAFRIGISDHRRANTAVSEITRVLTFVLGDEASYNVG